MGNCKVCGSANYSNDKFESLIKLAEKSKNQQEFETLIKQI